MIGYTGIAAIDSSISDATVSLERYTASIKNSCLSPRNVAETLYSISRKSNMPLIYTLGGQAMTMRILQKMLPESLVVKILVKFMKKENKR